MTFNPLVINASKFRKINFKLDKEDISVNFVTSAWRHSVHVLYDVSLPRSAPPLDFCQPRRSSRKIRAIYLEHRLAAQSTKRASASSFRMVINGRGQTALFTAAKRPSRTISGKGAREEPNRTGTTTYRARVSLGKRDRSAPTAIAAPSLPPFVPARVAIDFIGATRQTI